MSHEVKPQNADPLRTEASVVAIVRFVDNNSRAFYSGDVRYRGKWQFHNVPYWLQYWRYRIENETPAGWKGRVLEGAIFENHGGSRGQKIAQWVRGQGWIQTN